MKSLKNIYILAGFFYNIAFSDVTCIYNDTDSDLQIKEIKTGSWRFEHFILEEDSCRFDKVLKDNSDFKGSISPKAGFLIKYRYGYKKGSNKASVLLASEGGETFDIDPTSDEEGTSNQQSYEIIQQSRINRDTKIDHEKQELWFFCDKMVIISDKK